MQQSARATASRISAHAVSRGESLTLHVSGQCMAPDLLDGDRVQVQQKFRYRCGDVLAYDAVNQGTRPIHRYLGKVPTRSGMKVLLMADDASRPDSLISASAVFGKVVSRNGESFRTNRSTRGFSFLRYCRWALQLMARGVARQLSPRRLQER